MQLLNRSITITVSKLNYTFVFMSAVIKYNDMFYWFILEGVFYGNKTAKGLPQPINTSKHWLTAHIDSLTPDSCFTDHWISIPVYKISTLANPSLIRFADLSGDFSPSNAQQQLLTSFSGSEDFLSSVSSRSLLPFPRIVSHDYRVTH